MELPPYLGSANAITMNAVFGNLPDPREALLKAALLMQPGGYILISHPMGRAWHRQLHESEPAMVPHELPDKEKLQELTHGLPLHLVDYRDDPELYAAVLQVRLQHTPNRSMCFTLHKRVTDAGSSFVVLKKVHGFARQLINAALTAAWMRATTPAPTSL
jgi:hypothetical protein